jgi:hypothetical protein
VRRITLYTWLVFLLILASPFILQPWIEAGAHRPLLIEKHGRLVDAKTSAPLPNAIVIFHWWHTRAHADCPVQRATTTDANGAFVLPDVSADVSFDRDWFSNVLGTVTFYGYYVARYEYTISVYAPGFALVDPLHANFDPPALAYTLTDPPGREVGSAIELDPIKVTRTSFTPADEISYLARLKDTLMCQWPGQAEPPEVAKARAEIVERVRPLPCEIPATTTMKATQIAEYLLAANDKRLTNALQPPGALLGPRAWQQDLPAGVVCSATRE